MKERPTLGVGLMSGTSLDGMDAALVRFEGPARATLVAFSSLPYDDAQRCVLRRALESDRAPALARAHAQIGWWAGDAVHTVLTQAHARASDLDFIAFPGQTIWHEPPRVSWQLGEPAILAERFGVRVVSGFRARDVAAGGQGAPLVPMADVLLFGAEHPRVLLNLGGMANATFVPHREDENGVIAFDTGPGVAIIDGVARLVDPELSCDLDGRLSGVGHPHSDVVADLLSDPWFQTAPPRSTGREVFGDAYAQALHARVPGPDGVATAVELTACSVAEAIGRWMPPARELIVSGGGWRHPGLRRRVEEEITHRCSSITAVRDFGDVFFDGDAKEAVAFALLGYLTIHGQPGNIPSATGARGPRVLGQITPA